MTKNWRKVTKKWWKKWRKNWRKKCRKKYRKKWRKKDEKMTKPMTKKWRKNDKTNDEKKWRRKWRKKDDEKRWRKRWRTKKKTNLFLAILGKQLLGHFRRHSVVKMPCNVWACLWFSKEENRREPFGYCYRPGLRSSRHVPSFCCCYVPSFHFFESLVGYFVLLFFGDFLAVKKNDFPVGNR